MLPSEPGHSATELVALATSGVTPSATMAGSGSMVPPPAMAFTAPAAAPGHGVVWLAGQGRAPKPVSDPSRPATPGHAATAPHADHRGQRGPAAARVDILDRRPGRSRGPAARRGSYAVCRDPVPERAV